MYEYTDRWGVHAHELSAGPPYDPKAPITCPSCIFMLDTRMSAWLDVLTERHSLPKNFWNGYKFSWS